MPVIGFTRAFCLLLNVVQSVEDNAPLFVADAVGRLNVCVSVTDNILKSVPDVPTARYCTWAVNPFKAVNPVENVVSTSQRFPFSVCSVIVLPLVIT